MVAGCRLPARENPSDPANRPDVSLAVTVAGVEAHSAFRTDTVRLDARATEDPNGRPLRFEFAQIFETAGIETVLSIAVGPTDGVATFVPATGHVGAPPLPWVAGTASVRLRVVATNEIGSVAQVEATFVLVDRPPGVEASDLLVSPRPALDLLDAPAPIRVAARVAKDPDNETPLGEVDILSWEWRQVEGPRWPGLAGLPLTEPVLELPHPEGVLRAVFELEVTDGILSAEPVRVAVSVSPDAWVIERPGVTLQRLSGTSVVLPELWDETGPLGLLDSGSNQVVEVRTADGGDSYWMRHGAASPRVLRARWDGRLLDAHDVAGAGSPSFNPRLATDDATEAVFVPSSDGSLLRLAAGNPLPSPVLAPPGGTWAGITSLDLEPGSRALWAAGDSWIGVARTDGSGSFVGVAWTSAGLPMPVRAIAAGPDGSVWLEGDDAVLGPVLSRREADPALPAIFEMPTTLVAAVPLLASTPDELWFTEGFSTDFAHAIDATGAPVGVATIPSDALLQRKTLAHDPSTGLLWTLTGNSLDGYRIDRGLPERAARRGPVDPSCHFHADHSQLSGCEGGLPRILPAWTDLAVDAGFFPMSTVNVPAAIDPRTGWRWHNFADGVLPGGALVLFDLTGETVQSTPGFTHAGGVAIDPTRDQVWFGGASADGVGALRRLDAATGGVLTITDVVAEVIAVSPGTGVVWVADDAEPGGRVRAFQADGTEIPLSDPLLDVLGVESASADPVRGGVWMTDQQSPGSPAVIHAPADGGAVARFFLHEDGAPFGKLQSIAYDPATDRVWIADPHVCSLATCPCATPEVVAAALDANPLAGTFGQVVDTVCTGIPSSVAENAWLVAGATGDIWVGSSGGEVVHVSAGGVALQRFALGPTVSAVLLLSPWP